MSADVPECINIYKNVAGMWQGRGRGDRMPQEDPATTPPGSRGLERLHVVVRDLVHQPSELGFLGREGVWPVRLGEDLSCKKRSLQ